MMQDGRSGLRPIRHVGDEVIASLRRNYEERLRALPCWDGNNCIPCDSNPGKQLTACSGRGTAICPLNVRSVCSARNALLDEATQSSHSMNGERATAMGIPRRHWHMLGIQGGPVRPLVETPALALIAQYGELDTLILCGGQGCGKSAAATVWCWRHHGLFVVAADVAASSAYEKADILRFREPSHLVIDDLGVEYGDSKGVWRSKLDVLMSSRYNDCKKTLITTNLLPQKLIGFLGDRIIGRVQEVGRIEACAGVSLRTAITEG